MADMYGKRERGKASAIASFLPYLGPALGPIVGGVVAEKLDWPWIFWIMSIFNATNTLIGLILIRESYTPVLLQRKARKNNAGAQSLGRKPIHTKLKGILESFGINLWRPVRLLLKRPIIPIIGFTIGLNFAIYTMLLGTFANLFIQKYAESDSISSLNYIAIALAAIAAVQIGGHIMDWLYKKLSDRNNGQGAPEFRVPYLVPGVILVPVGLFIYGWAADYVLAWPLVDIGAAIFTLGSFIVSQMLYAYLLDEFLEHSASAMAAARVLSYTMAFAFPIFAPALYEELGYGWGNSLLAFLWICFCFPVPALLWWWGHMLRRVGKTSKDRLIDGV